MRITMVKKQLASGEPCEKCAQAEEMLQRRGHWDRIDEVVWVVEGDATSPGARLAVRHGVELAPFFIVQGDDGDERVFTSALRLVRDCFPAAPGRRPASEPLDLSAVAGRFATAEPEDILRWALERYGERCAIAFRGADDIVLIDMATRMGLPFRCFTVDTGRLPEQTHAYLDEVRRRYGVVVETYLPDARAVSKLVRDKGPNSFLRDGHGECCGIRRIEPLRRALRECDAWVTGKRSDPTTRGTRLPAIQEDLAFSSASDPLIRLNPLAGWTRQRVWQYIREREVPCNALHDRGFTAIGCVPCTRATGGPHGNREARWWWERPEPPRPLHESGDGI